MQIAIVGAGFAGVALTYFLQDSAQVTLFDAVGIAGGASGISSGLLHPFFGAKCHKAKDADAAMQRAKELIALTNIPFKEGIIRPVTTTLQHQNFQIAASKYPELVWTDDALFIPQGITLASKEYLLALWGLCTKAKLVIQKVVLEELSSFDAIVVAAGPQTKQLLPQLPIHLMHGQVIELDHPPPSHSLTSLAYITGSTSCLVGATYDPEGRYTDAEQYLRPRASKMIPALATAPLLRLLSGTRVMSPDKISPIAYKTTFPKTWVLTALGSRGLLYHALYAQRLAIRIMHSL